MNWLVLAGQLAAAILGGAGFTAVVKALAARPKMKADAADTLADSAVEWAKALKADAAEARVEMQAVREQANALAWQLYRLRAAILDPSMTMDRLRAMVPVDPSANGH